MSRPSLQPCYSLCAALTALGRPRESIDVNTAVRVSKRLIDIVGASIGLAVLAPLFPVVAAAVGVEAMGRSILVKRRRAGRYVARNGGAAGPVFREFRMLKLRTAAGDEAQTAAPATAPGKLAVFLERTRLDELPQLVNVLRGDMSLVGPRPERPEVMRILAAEFPLFEMSLSDLKPGMTGLGRVSARPSARVPVDGTWGAGPDAGELQPALDEDLQVKLGLDLRYIAATENLSEFLRLELAILAKTLIVFIGKLRA